MVLLIILSKYKDYELIRLLFIDLYHFNFNS